MAEMPRTLPMRLEIYTDRLEMMMRKQRNLQMQSFGVDPLALRTDEERAEFAFRNIVMLQDEAHEALGEVSWKWWATDKFFNEDKFREEVIDMTHFLLNLVLVSGMSPDDFFDLYEEKNDKNRRRQEAGYGGKSDKCEVCHAHRSEGCEHKVWEQVKNSHQPEMPL
jgi:hypothetical protein